MSTRERLVPLEDAQAHVMATCRELDAIEVDLADALGLVLADDVVAPGPVPPFANTAMDGYAVRAADTAGASASAPVRLRVVDELPAGRAPEREVGGGEAIRIMTGAPVPDGADAIVMVERTRVDGDDVLIEVAVEAGLHVRAAGGDIAPGQPVLSRGEVLTPAHLGVLASVDVARPKVFRRARVGVMSTGDELVAPGQPLERGQIRDSNRPMLLALAAAAGAEPVDLGAARDDEDLITERIAYAADTCDALLTSGGVSVGDYDYVKAGLERLAKERPGSAFVWWQVAIKPAKPFAFGTLGGRNAAEALPPRSGSPAAREVTHRDVPVFGLPGNPVSSLVSFELFARPALRRMMGHADAERPVVVARAGAPMRRPRDGKLHLDRVRVRYEDGGYVCERSGGQASNVLSAMAAANGLALLPDGDGVDAGGTVRVMLLS